MEMTSPTHQDDVEVHLKQHPEDRALTKEELEYLANPFVPLDDVLMALSTDASDGLTIPAAANRLELYGANELTKQGKMPLWLLFLSQFANLIILILLAAAVVSIIVGELVEGVAIIIIVLITASVATLTEYSSSNALAALAQLTDPHTHVYRGGKLEVIRTPELVPGDIVELSPGDLVPADIRIIESHHLKVNEMILTGESADVGKKATVSSEESQAKLTHVNMCYSSTSVVEGRVRAVVLLTGMNTRVGSIAALLNTDQRQDIAREASARLGPQQRVSMDISSDDDMLLSGESDSENEDEEEEAKDVETLPVVADQQGTWANNPYTALKNKINSLKPKTTPLQDELHRLGMIMTAFALCGAVLVVVIGIFRNFRDPNNSNNAPWLQSLMLAVSMAVSAIPEGLPLVVVICLALGTNAMAKKNTLVRRLPAVETLGSASIICSDKTGTLTSGKMTATDVWTHGHSYRVSGEGYSPNGLICDENDIRISTRDYHHHVALAATMTAANLCNDAEVRHVEGKWKPIGTSTEAALVAASEKFGIKTDEIREAHERELVIPFSSHNKLMATVHPFIPDRDDMFLSFSEHREKELLVLAKGAPFAILSRCRHILRDHTEHSTVDALDEEMRNAITEEADRLSSLGLRVLAVCYKRLPRLPQKVEEDVDGMMSADARISAVISDMVFAGLVGMMDPPRAGVRRAVNRARRGGVRTVMITGDYLKTAVAIAKMVNIIETTMDEKECAVDCSALRPHGTYLSPREIDAITCYSNVFARARPEDKIQIVKSFQRQDYVCAMTGDGVNDAPALRQANIGIAMGVAGSEVAKAASDMILTDDKFASIVEAVELGRTIYSNLRKFVMYLIGTNWSQVLVILVSILVGMPTPLEPLQILFINLITDGMPAIALSIEGPESDVMREPPRRRDEQILSGVIIMGILGHASVLVTFMLFVFVMGLWWNTGNVLLDKMYDSHDELTDRCHRLTDEGSWEVVYDDHCIEEGIKIARTMVFLTIAFTESFRPLTARSFSLAIHHNPFRNRAMIGAIAASVACIFFIVFVPGVNDVFHVTSPHWYEWLLIIMGIFLTILSDEHLKYLFREKRKSDNRWRSLFGKLENIAIELRNVRLRVNQEEGYEAIPKEELMPVQV